MDKKIKACIDRFVDTPMPYTPNGRNLFASVQPAKLFILHAKKWPKRNLKVRFLEGTSDQKSLVQEQATKWTKHANLQFEFITGADPADIRIAFNENLGSWSYIGVDSLAVGSQNEQTMNLGWIVPEESDLIKKNTIIHEFGHAIGCLHEHQHPMNGIKWNKQKVIADLSQPPNNWSPEQVEHNLFERYDGNITAFSQFDPNSIMIYPVPEQWTLDGTSYGFDKDGLSETDTFFITNMYP